MNRRGFLGRSAAVLAGIMASCQLMPELAVAQEPKPIKFLRSRKAPPSPLIDMRKDQHGRRWGAQVYYPLSGETVVLSEPRGEWELP